MLMLDDLLRSKLTSLEQSHNLRKLPVQNQALVDFTSNDYLGLARNQELAAIIEAKTKRLSPQLIGSTGSRLLSGNFEFTESVEKKLAAIFKTESSLIFNSGYNANLAVLSAIPQRNDLLLYDEFVHASIKDGMRLSFARRFSFKHNDVADLEAKLKRSHHRLKFIVIESVYSMNGDQSPLADYVVLAEKYNAMIILDEAHTTGSVGENGSGLTNSLGLQNKIDVRIHTFGKAMGGHGACVAGSHSLIQYLINSARPFIYTTALPTHTVASIDCSFDFLRDNIELQSKLSANIDLFVKQVKSPGLIKSSSPIQCVIIMGNEEVKSASKFLSENNLDVRPILSPTVPKGSERVRVCLHGYNTTAEITKLTSLLHQIQLQTNSTE
jgi:8-amino-7-oxononanoate synthase